MDNKMERWLLQQMLAFLFSLLIVFGILSYLIAFISKSEVIRVDPVKERELLLIELDQYYDRLATAERYDNIGDREWYSEMITYTRGKLEALDDAS